MKTETHDLVVIGAGPGGYVAAIRAAQLGMKVACVEKEKALGGTCLRIGCIPSKALLDSSWHYAFANEGLKSHGIQVSNVKLDLSALMKRKQQVVSTLTQGIDHLFKKNKITRYLGEGKISGRGKVVVQGGEEIELQARHILLASGSRPVTLHGIQLSGERIGTSTEALSYSEVPKHLIIIGAGIIGLELGSVWSRLGSKVTVLEYLDRILPGIDLELANEAQKIFEKQGIEFRLGVKVTAARVEGAQCVVEFSGVSPQRTSMGDAFTSPRQREMVRDEETSQKHPPRFMDTADRVLVAVGRKPNSENLGLESVGIEKDSKERIVVDARFACNVPGFYAIGDLIAGPMLAHKAEEEGIACVEGIATGNCHVDYNTIAGVVYTHPEIATVGRTEQELMESKIPFRKGVFPFLANGRARAAGEAVGKIKILAHAETDRILGVHILGPHAGELINEASAAIAFGASSEDLARTSHAHPTLGEAMKEAALAVDGRAIHI